MHKLIKVSLNFHWYTVLLFLVEAGLIAFGLWACLDSVSVGASHAGFRFLLLFVIWALPGIAVLSFVRPQKAEEPRLHTPASAMKQQAGA